MSKTVYTVGPITGLDADEAIDWFEGRANRLRGMGYTVLNPLSGKPHLRGVGKLEASGYEDPVSNDHSIFRRDHWMCHEADIIVADFSLVPSGGSRSIGSCFELAWASNAGKLVVVVLPTPEGGGRHPMDHAFVRQAATHVFASTLEAEKYLGGLVRSLGQV